eukprot:31091-Hanusia_phi.AAC.3
MDVLPCTALVSLSEATISVKPCEQVAVCRTSTSHHGVFPSESRPSRNTEQPKLVDSSDSPREARSGPTTWSLLPGGRQRNEGAGGERENRRRAGGQEEVETNLERVILVAGLADFPRGESLKVLPPVPA